MPETEIEAFQRHLSEIQKRELHTENILNEIETHAENIVKIVDTCKISSMIYRVKHANHLIGILTERRMKGILSKKEESKLTEMQNVIANAEYNIEHKCNCSIK